MNQMILDGINDLSATGSLPAIACGERPQQRQETFGVAALSDTELLAIVLQNGIRGQEVMNVSSRIVSEAGSIAGLASWQATDFQRLKGIGHGKGRQLVAIMEIARRAMR